MIQDSRDLIGPDIALKYLERGSGKPLFDIGHIVELVVVALISFVLGWLI